MTITLKPNIVLFAMTLLCNTLDIGEAIDPRRIRDKSIQHKLNKTISETHCSDLCRFLQQKGFDNNSLLRVNNFLLLPSGSSNRDKQLEEKFNMVQREIIEYIHSAGIASSFRIYSEYLNTLPEYGEDQFKAVAHAVLSFFHLGDGPISELYVHLNAIDSRGRGTNYPVPGAPLVSAPVLPNGDISFHAFRHEFMHLVLKEIFHDSLERYSYHLHVPENYSQDSRRVQFDEYFIFAVNTFFFPKEKQAKQAEYLRTHGFVDLNIFREYIHSIFITQATVLDAEKLAEMQQHLDKVFKK